MPVRYDFRVASDSKGCIWIYKGQRLWLLNEARHRVTYCYIPKRFGHIVSVAQARDKVVITTKHRVFLSSAGKMQLKAYATPPVPIEVMQDYLRMAMTHNGNLWLTTSEWMLLYQRKTHSWKWVNNFMRTSFLTISLLPNDHLLVGTTREGIMEYDEDGNLVNNYRANVLLKKSLQSNHIQSIYCDPQGKYLLVSYAKHGLSTFLTTQQRLFSLPVGIEGGTFLNDVITICPGPNNTFFLGTEDNGVYMMDARHPTLPAIKQFYPGQTVTGLFMDKKGRLWAGLYSIGLACSDGRRFFPNTSPYNMVDLGNDKLFGYEKATDTSLRLKNLTTSKTSLSTSATEITYTLTAEDVRQINLMQQSGDKAGDPVWYWIALRGQGFKAEGMYFVKNTQNIQIHDVTLDETKETSTIGEEPNVNVTLKRTFTKGQWATLMLPFNLTASQINDAFGPNCQVARFERNDIKVDTTESATHKYQIIYLTSRTHIYANQPMVIKINDDGYSKSSYTFDHVNMTFDNGETGGSYGNGYVQFGEYMVVGTYSLIPQLPKYAVVLLNKINAHHNDGKTRQDFYWVGDNTINNGGKRLKGFRWYMYWGAQDDLKVNFNDAANNDGKYVYSGSDPVSAKVYLDGQPLDDDATTAITGLPKAHVDDDCVFNLQGQYLGRRSKLNLAPGVYIMNGKKVKM